MPRASKDKNREYQKKWYAANRDLQKTRIAEQKKQKAEWLRAYKIGLKCSRCPEDHPACLDFHHLDPTTKKNGIYNLTNRGNSLAVIKAEIEKCVVLCANCHRKLHYDKSILLGEDSASKADGPGSNPGGLARMLLWRNW